jgi:Tol biopolymer transport system component
LRRIPLAILVALSSVAAAGAAAGLASSSPQARSATATASGVIVYSAGATPSSVPHLRLLNVDTGARRPLATKRFAHSASWSPDGTRVVFEDYGAHGSETTQLAVVTLRTGSIHRLTRSPSLDESPAWSPNGGRIVFSRAPLAGRDDGLWLVNAQGGGERHLTYNRFGDTCAGWSPDGKRIVFVRYRNLSGGRDLWLMRSDGKNGHRLIARATCATWSLDGTQLAFGRLTGRTIPGCGCAATDLYLADANGGKPRLLTRNGGDPTWSPDGSRIAFVRYDGRRSHLWLIDSDGTGLRQLTGGTSSQRAPAWQP